MQLGDILSSDSIVLDVDANSKKQILSDMSDRLSQLSGLPSQTILDALLDREKLGSTCLGSGIAIPHGKFSDLARAWGLVVRLNQPVDFDAMDGLPVDLVLCLLIPETAASEHLKVLARISRILRISENVSTLRAADTSAQILRILTET